MPTTRIRPVLIITNPDDMSADLVTVELQKRGAPIFRFDAADFPHRIHLDARLVDGQWAGTLVGNEHTVALESIGGIYYRRPHEFRLPEKVSDVEWEFARNEAKRGLGGVLSSLNCHWMNNPNAEALAEYKPQQLSVASECGLATPRTLVANSRKAVKDFAHSLSHPMICKTLRTPNIFEGEDELGIFANVVTLDDLDKLKGIELTAHQFQEWVPKQSDVRLIVANDQVFAVSLHLPTEAGQFDWQLDCGGMTTEIIEVPAPVVFGVRNYLSRFGLSYGTFDFIVTPEEKWVFLECDPEGKWAWIDNLTWPIATVIADYLVSPNKLEGMPIQLNNHC